MPYTRIMCFLGACITAAFIFGSPLQTTLARTSAPVPSAGSTGDWFTFVYPFHSLTFDPNNPTVLYKTDGPNIEMSTTSGVTWQKLGMENPAWGSNSIGELAIAPTSPRRMYAGTRNLTSSAGMFGQGVYISADGGTTWQHPSNTIAGDAITAIAVDPQTPDAVYAGIYTGRMPRAGIYKSVDGGVNWSVSGTGWPTDVFVEDLAVSPHDSRVVYAITLYDGLYRSVNSGVTWDFVNQTLPDSDDELGPTITLECDAVDPAYLYASAGEGIFRSTNGGMDWSLIAPAERVGVVFDFGTDPARPSTLYAVGTKGVMVSTDKGATWTSVSQRMYLPFVARSAR